MTRTSSLPVAALLPLLLLGCGAAGVQAAAPEELERTLPAIMARAGIPGLSCAVLGDGRVDWVRTFGVRSSATGEAADSETIFAAASFSKPVFAWLVMLLAEEGVLDLDRPLESTGTTSAGRTTR